MGRNITRRPRIPNAIPLKSPTTGDTLALLSHGRGLFLWCKRAQIWECFEIEHVLRLYATSSTGNDFHPDLDTVEPKD